MFSHLSVDNDFDNVRRNLLLVNILLNVLDCLIWGVVVNVDDFVVLVVLHEYGVQVTKIEAVANVVIGRDYDAEWKLLLFIFGDLIFGLDILIIAS